MVCDSQVTKKIRERGKIENLQNTSGLLKICQMQDMKY